MHLYNSEKHKQCFGGWVRAKKDKQSEKNVSFDGAIYKLLRKEKRKLTLESAAKKIGISSGFLSKIESSQKIPSNKIRLKLLQVYGYTEKSFRNFYRPERVCNISIKDKLNIILKSLDECQTKEIYEAAYKIRHCH